MTAPSDGGRTQPTTLTRAELNAAGTQLLKRGRSGLQPDTHLVRDPGLGRDVVVKDMRPRFWLARLTLGRLLSWREGRALERASGLDLAPHFLGRIDRDAFAIEFVAGEPLPRKWKDPEAAAFFDALEAGLARLHAAGVAHGDVRRTNILRRPDGRPALLDFASSTWRPQRWWELPAWPYFRLQCAVDRHTLRKIRHHVLRDADDPLAHYPWYMRVGRLLRKGLYRPIKKAREAIFGAPRRDREGLPPNR